MKQNDCHARGQESCAEAKEQRAASPTYALRLLLAATAFALAACGSNVLEFRNATISGGKVYAGSANEPFSGKLTNVPLAKLPATPIYKFTGLAARVSGNQELAGLLLAGAMANMLGSGPGLLCDAKISKGTVEGEVKCTAGGIPILEFEFADGAVDGSVTVFDPKNKGTRIAEATYKRGELDGKSKVMTPMGKAMHTVSWRAGLAEGPEEQFDLKGRLVFRGTLVAGKYEGEATRFNTDGSVAEKSTYVNGVVQEAPKATPPSAPVEACVDKAIAAHRKERGEDAIVKSDQLEEWRDACRSGKQPA